MSFSVVEVLNRLEKFSDEGIEACSPTFVEIAKLRHEVPAQHGDDSGLERAQSWASDSAIAKFLWFKWSKLGMQSLSE